MKTDKLKEEFYNLFINNEDIISAILYLVSSLDEVRNAGKEYDKIRFGKQKLWNWINSHYIPRDKVEGLKMKHIKSINPKRVEDLNYLINEINQKIKEVME